MSFTANQLRNIATTSGESPAVVAFNSLQEPMYQAATNGQTTYPFPSIEDTDVKSALKALLEKYGFTVSGYTTISWAEVIS